MVTELAKGKTLDEALKITRQDVADELDGLPPIKMHCSNLAADALKATIKNYKEKHKEKHKKGKEDKGPSKKEIQGEKEFSGKGVYHKVKEPSSLKDKRILIQDKGKESMELAGALAGYSPRVIFLTEKKSENIPDNLKAKLKKSNVKILYESELIGILGLNEVEKVKIHDLDEDNTYELFVDAVVI